MREAIRNRRFAPCWAAASLLSIAFATGCAADVLRSVGTRVEEFTQNSASKIDVLWVVDNSASMSEEQDALGLNFQTFIDNLQDTGIDYHGYQSDFGRTFVVGRSPSARQLEQGRRWLEVVDAVLGEVRPGVSGRDLTRRAIAAADGAKPWLDHFYLIHGVGSEAAEQPLIGTDLGESFDESVVLAPGMVLVLEPAIWDDGHAGYRSEEIVAVTGEPPPSGARRR